MALGTSKIRQAVYDRLKNQLTGYTNSIYTHVPDVATFPYIRLGNLNGSPWDAKTFDGQRYSFDIHVFNKNVDSPLTVDTIKELIHTALNRQETALNTLLAGYSPSTAVRVTLCRYLSDVTLQEADAIPNGGDHYYHGVITYEVLCSNA